MSDIFISYARKDRSRAKELAEALERLGWSVWWERRIRPGESFDDVIEEALEEAHCVVVLWSKHSVKSRWVRAEANEGLHRNILVPAFLEDVKLRLIFRGIQAADLSGWSGDEKASSFRDLVAALTEAEWEYAARADTTGEYAGNLDEMAWYDKELGVGTSPVGQGRKPNACGLYDMHGNVWEWVQDRSRETTMVASTLMRTPKGRMRMAPSA